MKLQSLIASDRICHVKYNINSSTSCEKTTRKSYAYAFPVPAPGSIFTDSLSI